MLRAVLETLYAGVGVCKKDEAKVKDPKVEVLSMVSIEFLDVGAMPGVSHVDDLPEVALSDQGQQGGGNALNSYDIDVQVLAQVIPVCPSVNRRSWIREVSEDAHVHDSIRGHVHDASVVDKDIDTLTIERLLHYLSGLLCALGGRDLERDELHAAVGAFYQLLQVIRLLASSCENFGDFGGRSGCERGR